MDIKQLNTFLVLSRLLNFTKTANQLNYAQSSVSFQIQQLESELHVKLFEQIGKKIYLTDAGEALLPYANQIVQASDEMLSRFNDFQAERLVIGSSESLSTYVLPSVLRRLKDEFEQTDLYLKIIDTTEFVSAIKDRSIDIGITLDSPINDPAIRVIASKCEPLGLYCTFDYPLLSETEVTDEMLRNIPMIVTGRNCPYRKVWESRLRNQGIIPKAILETGSVPAIKENTLSGLGVCILPECTVKDELSRKQMRKLNYPIESKVYSQLLIHKDKLPNSVTSVFISLIQEYLT